MNIYGTALYRGAWRHHTVLLFGRLKTSSMLTLGPLKRMSGLPKMRWPHHSCWKTWPSFSIMRMSMHAIWEANQLGTEQSLYQESWGSISWFSNFILIPIVKYLKKIQDDTILVNKRNKQTKKSNILNKFKIGLEVINWRKLWFRAISSSHESLT